MSYPAQSLRKPPRRLAVGAITPHPKSRMSFARRPGGDHGTASAAIQKIVVALECG